jgi:diguanylate cyclase (GGDEF)-like protein
LFLLAIFAVIDLQTGNELSFSVFYTIPISIASWYAGRRIGFLLCCACAVTWYGIDDISGAQYSHPSIPLWNAAVRFAFFVIISTLFSRLRDALDAQVALARRDGLTGILNARGFAEESELLLKLAHRHGHSLALGYLDLDNFKGVNDSFGHSTGDEVIRAVASVLEKQVRGSDRCARIGGDEFAILLVETGMEGAQVLFPRLKSQLVELAAQHSWPIGFSFGVLVLDAPKIDIVEALRQTDELMYSVKKTVKNNILFRTSPIAGSNA